MKYIYLILIALIGFTSSAQDPRLFENTWYLQNVIIDGQDNFPPSNEEVPYVPLWMEQNHLETSVCDTGSGMIEFSSIDSSFFFTNGMAMTLGNCYISDNFPFQVIYFHDFFNSNYITVDDIFVYEIIDGGDNNYTLTITSAEGNQAIYGNQILATEDFKEFQFYIYPNPASDHLSLSSKDIHGTIEVRIFNVEGKLLKKRYSNGKNDFQMDISSLSSGLYFLKIQTEEGNVVVKKFLKE